MSSVRRAGLRVLAFSPNAHCLPKNSWMRYRGRIKPAVDVDKDEQYAIDFGISGNCIVPDDNPYFAQLINDSRKSGLQSVCNLSYDDHDCMVYLTEVVEEGDEILTSYGNNYFQGLRLDPPHISSKKLQALHAVYVQQEGSSRMDGELDPLAVLRWVRRLALERGGEQTKIETLEELLATSKPTADKRKRRR